MATTEQIKALLKNHFARDGQRFFSVTLQVAAKDTDGQVFYAMIQERLRSSKRAYLSQRLWRSPLNE